MTSIDMGIVKMSIECCLVALVTPFDLRLFFIFISFVSGIDNTMQNYVSKRCKNQSTTVITDNINCLWHDLNCQMTFYVEIMTHDDMR